MSKSKSDIRIVITPGEPAGIGPDVAIQSFAKANKPDETLLFVADPELLKQRAQHLNLSIDPNVGGIDTTQKGAFNILPVKCGTSVKPGVLDPLNAAYVIECLEEAVRLCKNGAVDAMVTGPVQKSLIADSGIPFSGHTEWLADKLGVSDVVMMLAAKELRVALVTTHLPLSAVPAAITPERVRQTLQISLLELQNKFAFTSPRIMVCGLNPHAGESGQLGQEEVLVIQPVIEEFQNAGLEVFGPVPADTAFTPAQLSSCDAVVAMYHDQGLPVIKSHHFDEAVNITLGLPIIRTSVDHGTALDLAGSGSSNPASMIAAISAARHLASTSG